MKCRRNTYLFLYLVVFSNNVLFFLGVNNSVGHATWELVASANSRWRRCAVTHKQSLLTLSHPEVADSVDMSKPMYWDRRDTPLPDRAYKDVLTTADNSLKRKEKGPWGQLTKEEKIACRSPLTHCSLTLSWPKASHSGTNKNIKTCDLKTRK